MIAYCWASGLIEFGQRCPRGAIPILHGYAKVVRHKIYALARRGYHGELLVPGIPEARDSTEAGRALGAFVAKIIERGVSK
jgi:hypothetical protein